MIYGYKCRTCGGREVSTTRANSIGPCTFTVLIYTDGSREEWMACDGELTRDYSGIAFGAVPQHHYNATLNREVSSGRGFDEALKRESEIASIRTGMAHKFERVDPSDKKALGVTDEGMDSTNRQRVKQGLPPIR